jgi:DNA-binding response OmpR family regulator
MSKMTILLLEDDLPLSQTIQQFLEHIGYKVLIAYDALKAKELLYEHAIDLMLLDVKVPHQNGFEFLAEYRAKGNTHTPAIFITSLNRVEDVTKGFESGCDDYIRKPFALKELQVRIEALSKRSFGTNSEVVDLGNGYTFHVKGLFLSQEGKEVALTTKEVNLLSLFLKQPNKLLRYEEIFEVLWSFDEEPSHGSLRAYVNKLRHLLGKERFVTVKNEGYRYVVTE